MSDKHKPGIGYEHPNSHQIQIGSIVTFFIIWLLDSFLIQFALDVRNIVPLALRVILFIIGLIVSYLLFNYSHEKIFLPPGQKSQLVTDGAYSYVRHPMYISVLVLLLSFYFISLSFLALIVWLIAVFFFDRMMIFEEAELLKALGTEYREYMNQVSRWIPRVSSFKR
jgi:protein-S-isoprenylcysteine O-methyltransferase Ste14